eukprot:TRINITY_DN35835_c0_g1_i1.p1 TRINITY_DN35835_c0_g1~~TRINITY_DN35835_c0_g1_i1.p1  ORF type:complete len:319 (-),score=53.18 TRINITY_DN35835_c0_g1_i1:84-1040(-)
MQFSSGVGRKRRREDSGTNDSGGNTNNSLSKGPDETRTSNASRSQSFSRESSGCVLSFRLEAWEEDDPRNNEKAHGEATPRDKPMQTHDKKLNLADKGKTRRTSNKEFAWMDSEDDESGGERASGSAEAPHSPKRGDDSEKRGASDPDESIPASEIQSFGQMIKMAPKFQSKLKTMQMPELAAVCQAAARVKFYDSGFFESVTAAAKRHLSGKGRQKQKPADIVDILDGLAGINACDKPLFELMVQALEDCPQDQIDASLRKRILKAVTASGHKSEHEWLKSLATKEAEERYSRACDASATAWQKRDENNKHRTFWWT